MRLNYIPSHIYRPQDFTKEVASIEKKCFKVSYGQPCLQDRHGNVYRINFADCSIQVN